MTFIPIDPFATQLGDLLHLGIFRAFKGLERFIRIDLRELDEFLLHPRRLQMRRARLVEMRLLEYQLEVASTVIEHCKSLAKSLATQHGIDTFPAISLMKEMVGVTGEKWVSASRFTALADRFGVTQVGGRIALMAGCMQILRQLPVKVFADTDVRQSVLGAAQEALDGTIDQEEESA